MDANILFSALIRGGIVRTLLLITPFNLYTPEHTLNEINKHKDIILSKSGLTEEEFNKLLSLITENITITPKDKYQDYLPEALEIIGNVDKDDSPFIALALSLKADGIWTEDKDFEKQDKVRVLKTEDIIQLLIEE